MPGHTGYSMATLTMAALWPSVSEACTPMRFAYDADNQTLTAYAKTLLHIAGAIFYARVVDARIERAVSSETQIGFADIELLKVIKDPSRVRRIYTKVQYATCSNPMFQKGEKRLFVLASVPQQSGEPRLFELHAWQSPSFSDAKLLAAFEAIGSQAEYLNPPTIMLQPSLNSPFGDIKTP
jgi:hypothetical protein